MLVLAAGKLMAAPITFPQIEGWKRVGETLSFNTDNLYEHINGASEFYLSYSFTALEVASWENSGSELTIEVYTHSDPLNAYGIFSAERSEKAEIKPVGLEGYGDKTSFNFVTGVYYVKIYGTRIEATTLDLEKLAANFASTLCAAPVYPGVISLFPKEGLVKNSFQFIPGEFMGLGFMGSAAKAKYLCEGENLTLFIIERGSFSGVEALLKRYFSYCGTNEKGMKEGDIILKDPFNGTVHLWWNGKYLVGVTGGVNKKAIFNLIHSVKIG